MCWGMEKFQQGRVLARSRVQNATRSQGQQFRVLELQVFGGGFGPTKP